MIRMQLARLKAANMIYFVFGYHFAHEVTCSTSSDTLDWIHEPLSSTCYSALAKLCKSHVRIKQSFKSMYNMIELHALARSQTLHNCLDTLINSFSNCAYGHETLCSWRSPSLPVHS